MVDNVSNHGVNQSELQSLGLGSSQQIGRKDGLPGSVIKGKTLDDLLDQADISETAKARVKIEREASKYARLLFDEPEEFDADKVSQLKAMVDGGRINEYLNRFSNEDLADSLLASPAAAVLR